MRRDVQTINTLFAQSTNESFGGGTRIDIPGLDPVQFDVAPPPAPGAGATISATLLPQSVGGSFTVLAPGGGYPVSSTSIPVTVNGGDFDSGVPGAAAAVLTANSNAAGQITSIGGTLGFGYRSQATLTIGGGGTGAIVRVNYSSSVASPFGSGTTSGTTITAGGSGYFIAPNVLFRGFDFNGQAVEGSATGELVSGGALVNFTSPGTTFAFLSGPPIIQPVNPATSTVSFYNINNNGVLTGVFLNSGGAGYNPGIPPVVTVRDLRTPGGTGAQIHASTSTAGTVDNFVVITGGSAYSTTSTANFPSSAESFLFTTENDGGDLEDNRTIIVLRPGVNRIISVHYGTGIRSRGVE
ncbi:MAG: hypothetical protein HC811_00670 [Flammeovirgaceae bacterium]|nr:hypothetical protein [Flammeovirgaceae bacterium]